MAKEKISRTKYDEMRSHLLKKKDAKVNLNDYEIDEPVSHHSNDNEDMKHILKRKQNMKNTIRLTESELKRVINESVKNILNEMHPYGGPSTYQEAIDIINNDLIPFCEEILTAARNGQCEVGNIDNRTLYNKMVLVESVLEDYIRKIQDLQA